MGPNTLGMNVPGRGLLGSIAPSFCKPGRLALISRSGTLTLAMARQLSAAGIGQSLVAHIGGDTVIGRNPHEYLEALAHHDGTDAVLYCGEIGGDKEYALAEAARGFRKPVVAMVIGRHAPAEKRMGHAGALIGSAQINTAVSALQRRIREHQRAGAPILHGDIPPRPEPLPKFLNDRDAAKFMAAALSTPSPALPAGRRDARPHRPARQRAVRARR